MKKIRGWKNKLRQLQNWKNEYSRFNLVFLKENHVDYVKLFNHLDLAKIPAWYKKEVALALNEVLTSWREQADKHLDQYYIRLHINEDNIFESQLMIAINNQIEEYKGRFIKLEKQVTLPSWLKDVPLPLEAYGSFSVWLEDEIESLDVEEKDTLLKNLIEIKKISSHDGHTYNEYFINEGTLWCFDYEKKFTEVRNNK